MKISVASVFGMFVITSAALSAAPDPQWLGHDRERPLPAVVNPGTASTQDQPGTAPSDAVVLFDRQSGGHARLEEHGIRLISVLTLEVLLTYLRSSGKIGEEWYRKSMAFFEANRDAN